MTPEEAKVEAQRIEIKRRKQKTAWERDNEAARVARGQHMKVWAEAECPYEVGDRFMNPSYLKGLWELRGIAGVIRPPYGYEKPDSPWRANLRLTLVSVKKDGTLGTRTVDTEIYKGNRDDYAWEKIGKDGGR